MPKSDELYETDFFCWTVQNAALLRERKFDQIDLEHIAEEIEDMGKRDRRGVENRFVNLLMHLLKWQYQPRRRSTSWNNSIVLQRDRIPALLGDSPSLGRHVVDNFDELYRRAVVMAADQTKLPDSTFPERCPYSLEQVLDRKFYPD